MMASTDENRPVEIAGRIETDDDQRPTCLGGFSVICGLAAWPAGLLALYATRFIYAFGIVGVLATMGLIWGWIAVREHCSNAGVVGATLSAGALLVWIGWVVLGMFFSA